MQRYFIMDEMIENQQITMSKEQWHHISKVMRMHEGQSIYCIDSTGLIYLCQIQDLNLNKVKIIEKLDENHELDVHVRLIYGLPRNDKFEFVLQKATELGVHEIVPFVAKRSIVKANKQSFDKKYPRYQKILMEASEQSYRNKIPQLHSLVTLNQMDDFKADVSIIAYEESAKSGEISNLKHQLSKLYSGMSVNIVVGPEGGFDQSEVDFFESLGYVACGLGNRILRSESAPIYLLSVIGYTRELDKKC